MSETVHIQDAPAATPSKTFFGQVMGYFALAIASWAGGIMAGFYLLPPALIMSTPFLLGTLAVTLVLIFTAKKWSVGHFGYLFLIGFAALFGITIVPLLAVAAMTAGAVLIYKALFATVAMYAGLALYGLTTHRDLSGMGGFLMAGLIGMIAVSLTTFVLSLFGVNVWGSTIELVFSSFGVLLFAGFTIYDFQKIKSSAGHITPIEGAIQLFLNFILLFQYVLRLMLALTNRN